MVTLRHAYNYLQYKTRSCSRTTNEINIDFENKDVNVSFEGDHKTFDDDQIHTLLRMVTCQTDINTV